MVSSDHIYHVLRQEILSLTLLPGTQLREEELAARFGVSRTPVRGAISRLSSERLIQVVPRKGTFVAEIDFAYSRQLVFLRTSVEQRLLPMLCASPPEGLLQKLEENLARQKLLLSGEFQPLQFYRLDNRFHELYFSAMGLDAVWKVLQQFHAHYTRFRMLDMRESGLFGGGGGADPADCKASGGASGSDGSGEREGGTAGLKGACRIRESSREKCSIAGNDILQFDEK